MPGSDVELVEPPVGGRRIDELDGLRTVALLGALTSHAGLNRGGWIGVDVFFVLSGFLITSILVRRRPGPNGYRTFIVRRVRRLLPMILFVVASVSGLLMLGLRPGALSASSAYPQGLAALGYVANWYEILRHASYWDQFAQSPFGHLWSLSIEEQFYFVFPLIMFGLARTRLRTRTIVIGVLAASSATWSIWLGSHVGNADRVYFGSDTRAAGLLFGALAALILSAPGRTAAMRARHRVFGVVGAVALLGLLAGSLLSDGKDAWVYKGGLVGCSALGTLVVVGIASGSPLFGRWLRWRPLVWIGQRTYGYYLWHLPVFVFLPRVLHDHPWWLFVVGSTIALVLSALTFRLVEQVLIAPRHLEPELRPARGIGAVVAATVLCAGGLAVAVWVSERPQAVAEASVDRPAIDGASIAVARDLSSVTPVTLPAVRHLMVVGDSTALSLATLVKIPGVTINNNALLGCAQLRNDELFIDGRWQPTAPVCRMWRNDLWGSRLGDADTTLWFFGAWDLADAKVGGRILRVGTPEHDAWVRSELTDAWTTLTAGGRRLMLSSALCYPDSKIPDAYRRAVDFNRIFADFARTHERVQYLPIIDFLCDGPAEVRVNGVNPRPDGVHFELGTAKRIWEWFLPYLHGSRHGVSMEFPDGD